MLMMLMLNKKFLLMWLNFAEHHSVSKLSLVVHKLKVATDHLEVSDSVVWQYMCVHIGKIPVADKDVMQCFS